MFVEECYNLGYIYKAHGINGELVIKSELELSEKILKNWESIFIKINGILVPFFIENYFFRSENEVLIKFEGIENDLNAKSFVEHTLYIDKNTYENNNNTANFINLIGFSILTPSTEVIGMIEEILEYPGQEIFVVTSADNSEILIPAREEWLTEIDETRKTITMNLPDGLIDLN